MLDWKLSPLCSQNRPEYNWTSSSYQPKAWSDSENKADCDVSSATTDQESVLPFEISPYAHLPSSKYFDKLKYYECENVILLKGQMHPIQEEIDEPDSQSTQNIYKTKESPIGGNQESRLTLWLKIYFSQKTIF